MVSASFLVFFFFFKVFHWQAAMPRFMFELQDSFVLFFFF